MKPLALCTVLSISIASAFAGTASSPSGEEWAGIDRGLTLIRHCQLESGLIRLKADTERVWCIPYESNFAAMALLAANQVRPNPQDVRRVERWLLWYAANQEADGTICDQEGTVSSYHSNGRRDSTDAYAATFLMTVRRYTQAISNQPAPAITSAAQKAFGAIIAVLQPDGLTIAKPGWPIKYLIDNIEVYGGLEEGVMFFELAGREKEAVRARQTAERIAEGLRRFWVEPRHAFAVALDNKGAPLTDRLKSYPFGLAQLFALAYLAPEKAQLWRLIRQQFKPGDNGMPIERWLIASSRCAPQEVQVLRAATKDALVQFTPSNVNVDRPALAVLALIDGAARFPSVPTASPQTR